MEAVQWLLLLVARQEESYLLGVAFAAVAGIAFAAIPDGNGVCTACMLKTQASRRGGRTKSPGSKPIDEDGLPLCVLPIKVPVPDQPNLGPVPDGPQ